MGKNNGESGGLPLFETYNGKKKRIKKSLPSCIHLCPRLWRSLHRTHLWTILRVDIKKEEEKRTLGNERRKPTQSSSTALFVGALRRRVNLSLSLSIYIYIDDDEQKNARI